MVGAATVIVFPAAENHRSGAELTLGFAINDAVEPDRSLRKSGMLGRGAGGRGDPHVDLS
jgi:hypothetical protein